MATLDLAPAARVCVAARLGLAAPASVEQPPAQTAPLPPEQTGAERRLRRQRNARSVHRLGARVLFELVDELARHYPKFADDIDRRLERFAEVDPDALGRVGGDKFAPPPPARLVRASR
jgi:hypothetical protein